MDAFSGINRNVRVFNETDPSKLNYSLNKFDHLDVKSLQKKDLDDRSFDQQTVNTMTKGTVRSGQNNEEDNKSTRTARTKLNEKQRFNKI